jgi:energy-coupling factor transport system permease protein
LSFNHPLYLSVLLSVTLLIGYIGKILSNLRRIWVILLLLFTFSTLLWPLFLKGETLIFRYRFLAVSRESLLYGLGMGLRLSMMVISGMIFLSCTRVEEFTAGLQKFGVPFPVSFALSTAFRLLPTFLSTTSTIISAQKSRGLDLDSGGVFKRLKKHIPLIIPILVYGIRKTELLAMALEAKGFGSPTRRASFLTLKMGFYDIVVLLFLIGLNAFCIYLRTQGFGVVLNRL